MVYKSRSFFGDIDELDCNLIDALNIAICTEKPIFVLESVIEKNKIYQLDENEVHIDSKIQRPSEKETLYQNLLAKARHDKNLVKRLIEYERERMPDATEEELIRSAIERWERDNR